MIAQIQMRRGTTAEWAAASPVVLAAGEPGWDSTLEGMKVGDGSTEWAALPWIDAKNRPDINADTLDGVHLADINAATLDGVQLSDIRLGQNILHNWDFRNPVNQRDVSGTISTGAYFFDRWIRNSGTVTVAAGYLTLASGAVIEQRIEGLYLADETVTVSVQTDAETISGTGVFPTAAGTVDITLTGFGTATLGYNAGYMFVRFAASGGQNVEVVKLEFGTVSTLHLDPPADYGMEYIQCQRYYLWTGKSTLLSLGGHAVATTQAMGFLPTAIPMRSVPTIINADNSFVFAGTYYPATIAIGGVDPNGIILLFNTSGLTANTVVGVRCGNLKLSSDL